MFDTGYDWMYGAILIAWTNACRTSATVTTMRASTVAYAKFRKLQMDHIRDNLAARAREQGQEQVEDLDSDAASESAEELEDDEYREHEAFRPVTQLLQLVKPVETRWNSTMFMIQR